MLPEIEAKKATTTAEDREAGVGKFLCTACDEELASRR
jgi:hypothetical protein